MIRAATGAAKQDVLGLYDQTAHFSEVPSLYFPEDASPEVYERAIDFARIIEQGKAVVYLRFPQLHSLGQLVLRLVRDAVKHVAVKTANRRRVHLFVDEYHLLCDRTETTIPECLALSRDLSLHVYVSFRSWAQILARAGEGRVKELFGENQVYLGSDDAGYSHRLCLEEDKRVWYSRQ